MFVDRILELDQMFRRNREEDAARNHPTGTIRARIAALEEEKKSIVARTAKIKRLPLMELQ